MAEKQTQEEESFRESLEDVLAVVQGLSPYCKNLEELSGLVKLALSNTGQLRLLMRTVQTQEINSKQGK